MFDPESSRNEFVSKFILKSGLQTAKLTEKEHAYVHVIKFGVQEISFSIIKENDM